MNQPTSFSSNAYHYIVTFNANDNDVFLVCFQNVHLLHEISPDSTSRLPLKTHFISIHAIMHRSCSKCSSESVVFDCYKIVYTFCTHFPPKLRHESQCRSKWQQHYYTVHCCY